MWAPESAAEASDRPVWPSCSAGCCPPVPSDCGRATRGGAVHRARRAPTSAATRRYARISCTATRPRRSGSVSATRARRSRRWCETSARIVLSCSRVHGRGRERSRRRTRRARWHWRCAGRAARYGRSSARSPPRGCRCRRPRSGAVRRGGARPARDRARARAAGADRGEGASPARGGLGRRGRRSTEPSARVHT